MDWGLQNRLSRIIKSNDGKAVMLAVDHGYFLGPTESLEQPKKTIQPLLKYCDSLMLTRGVLRTSVDARFPVPVVLRVSGGSSIIGQDLSNEKITTSVRDAIRLNVSALAMSIFVGAKYEHNSLVNLGNLVNEAEEYGIPVLAVTAVGKELAKRDARYLSLSCRIAAEFGAHIVKTYYCDHFEKVVESCPVPIIIAGGPKLEERKALELTYNAVNAGAVGVDMGRNIWQSKYPVPMIRAVRAIVHGNVNVNEAYELFKRLCKESPSKDLKQKPQSKPQPKPQPKKQSNSKNQKKKR
jgi:putative autoinducer-2 (AI-2) aldolase